MRTHTPIALLLAVALLGAAGAGRAEPGDEPMQETHPTPAKSGHVEANGLDYYYEIHGEGEPLLLLHGGLGTVDMFDPVLPTLAEGRRVIAVDLHGHGRTELGDRPIRLEAVGDDLAAVVKRLGYASVDVLGYSMGAGVGLRMAVQHPGAVRRLALVSAAYARDGFYPEILTSQEQVGAEAAEAMKQTPMYQAYAAVAPRPEDFPKLLDAMGELMARPYDWTEEVKGLEMPVMLVYGDADMFRPEHVVDFYQLLGGGLRDPGWNRERMPRNRLAILPDLTHYEIFAAPAMARTVLPFLDGESGAPSWAEQIDARPAHE